jgi:tetratricopeptide (TPR) repeat protein
LCCNLCVLGASPARVRAEPAPSPTNAPAGYDRSIEEALSAYEAGRFAEARSAFRRAHDLMPTARTLRSIGMCSFNLGDYTDAAFQLERARKEERKPLTEEQHKHVAELIARANQRIGRFHLDLVPKEATLVVDGRPPLILERTELMLESGHHDIEVRADGYLTAHSTINVEGGDRTTLVFRLNRDDYAVTQPALVANGARANVPLTRPEEPTGSHGWMRSLGYTTLGLGAASLVGFAVVGSLALAQKSKLDDHCPNTSCSTAYRSEVDRYDTLRTLSTVTLLAGGALAATGLALLIARPAERPERARLVPFISPGGVGVRGAL